MQIIHVYDPSGKELVTRDLAELKKPLLVAVGEAGPELVETAAPGAEVIGALVPNEDGWSLAAVSLERPVVAGPKSAPDMQLTAGTVCALGGFTFRMECDRGTTGAMLLWRYEGSKVVADQVSAGRNIVAVNAVDSRPAVNPALAGEEIFEFFPSANGIDVIAGVGDRRSRQQFDAGTLFAVGGFEGMYLSGKDAEAAMKSSNPFGWPSRGPRLKLFAGVYLLALLFAGAAWLSREVKRQQAMVDAPRGAVQVAPKWKFSATDAAVCDTDGRELMFEIKFYQSLNEVLGREPSLVAADLIRTGSLPEFTNNTEIARSVKFLKDVTEIQTLVKSGRWEALREMLGRVDRAMVTRADADAFYDDAKEISVYINELTPMYIDMMLKGTYVNSRDDARWEAAYAAVTNNNVFYDSPGVQRSIETGGLRIKAVEEYCKAREKMRKAGDAVDAECLRQTSETFRHLDEYLQEDVYASVVSNELVKLRGMVRSIGDGVVKRACDAARDDELVGVLLLEAAELGGQVGLDAVVLSEWRRLAKDSAKRLDDRLRALYQEYRIKSTSDLKAGKVILAEMARMSAGGNRFGVWARREQERLAEKDKKKEVGK